MAAVTGSIKRYLPKSLFWRAFLILVIPILALQGVVASVFVQRHYDGVTAQMTASVARELVGAIARASRAATGVEETIPPSLLAGIEESNEPVPYDVLCLIAAGLDCNPIELLAPASQEA